MPTLSRFYVRTALACLLIGVVLGGLLLANKGVSLWSRMYVLLGAHVVLVTWGWLCQLTFGVAFWILPRFHGERPRAWLAWAAYALLNAGLLSAVAGIVVPGPWPAAMSGLLQFLAACAFAAHIWPRVKPAGA